MLRIFHQVSATGLLAGHILLAICVTCMCCSTNVTSVPLSAGSASHGFRRSCSILYVIVGINRVKRRANQLRDKRPNRYESQPPLSPPGAMTIWPRWSGPETIRTSTLDAIAESSEPTIKVIPATMLVQRLPILS